MSKQQKITLTLTCAQVEEAVREYVSSMLDTKQYDVRVVTNSGASVEATRKRERKPAKPKVVAAKAAA